MNITHQNPGPGRTTWLGLLVVLFAATSLWAHNGEEYIQMPPRDPPPPPPKPQYPTPVYELRWSWVHWWEANRELYLHPAGQPVHRQDMGQESLDALRTDASAALLLLLDDAQVEARMAAASALGRIGGPPAEGVIEKLIDLAEHDTHEKARFRAVLAIGMIGGEESEQFLGQYDPKTTWLSAARLIATGYIREPSDKLREKLTPLLADPEPMIRDAAQLALSLHPEGIDEETAMTLVMRESSPWLVADAELALGRVASERGARVLSAVVTDNDVIREWRAWHYLEENRKKAIGPITVHNYEEWLEGQRRLYALSPTPVGWLPKHLRPEGRESLDNQSPPLDLPNLDQMNQSTRPRMVKGVEQIYLARLRASAAIALGEVGDQPGVVDALLELVRERPQDYNALPQGFALISLGKIGSKDGLEDLLKALSDRDGSHLKTQEKLDSPTRGMAAIALGLYARPYDSVQGVTNRPGFEHALRMLQERLADDREKLEVRCACAVALGLSARTENLKTLITGYPQFDDESRLLGGYVLLGRALLGDRNLIEPVTVALERRPDRDETTDQLARRSAVLALGVMGTGDAIPVLVNFWNEPFFVNREIILALSLCNTQGLASTILPIMQESNDPFEKEYMAEILGRMLSRDRPPPYSRLLIGSNYPVNYGLQTPYRAVANLFMYEYLIPQFEDPWY